MYETGWDRIEKNTLIHLLDLKSKILPLIHRLYDFEMMNFLKEIRIMGNDFPELFKGHMINPSIYTLFGKTKKLEIE